MRSISRSRIRRRGSRPPWARTLTVILLVSILLPVGVASGAGLTVSSNKLATFATCTLSGSVGTSASMEDSFVDENAPTTNNGAAATIPSQSRNNRNRRPYVIFDLTTCSPNVPSSATITNATLRLYATALPATCRTQDVFRVTASWTESAITWNNQPFGMTANNPPSGSRTDGVTVGTGAGCTFAAAGYVSWNVTGDAAAFVAATSTNNGWMIRDDAENAAGLGSCSLATSRSPSSSGSARSSGSSRYGRSRSAGTPTTWSCAGRACSTPIVPAISSSRNGSPPMRSVTSSRTRSRPARQAPASP
jgi:hypothetical protein